MNKESVTSDNFGVETGDRKLSNSWSAGDVFINRKLHFSLSLSIIFPQNFPSIWNFSRLYLAKYKCPWTESLQTNLFCDKLEAALMSADSKRVTLASSTTLRTVPTIVTAQTYCPSQDTRVSYGWCLLIHREYYMAVQRYEISLRVFKNIFQHEKRNFVSPSGQVMFYLLYKHQWNAKPFHFLQ